MDEIFPTLLYGIMKELYILLLEAKLQPNFLNEAVSRPSLLGWLMYIKRVKVIIYNIKIIN